MPARFGFPSGVRDGVDALPWAAAGSGASVTVASKANPLTSQRLCIVTSTSASAPAGADRPRQSPAFARLRLASARQAMSGAERLHAIPFCEGIATDEHRQDPRWWVALVRFHRFFTRRPDDPAPLKPSTRLGRKSSRNPMNSVE